MRLGPILRGTQVPRGFLGMLALVLLFEATIRLNRASFTSYNALTWVYAQKRAVTVARRAEIVCLGDSRVKYAVLPRVFRAASGREACNLAVTAGRPPSSYYLLRHALDAGARPRAIVVDFDDKLLADEPLAPDAPPPWAELLTAAEAAELEQAASADGFTRRTILEHALPSFKNRHELRAMVTRLLRGRRVSPRMNNDVVRRNWAANEGAQVNAKRKFRVPAQPVRPEGHVEGTWAPHPVNARYVERLLALAHQRAIPVYWLLTPRCPTVQTWRDWYGEEARYERFVARMVGRFPNLVIVDARHSGYDADVFVDTVHLDRDGATALSRDLAVAIEVLPTRTPVPRWATLPPYSDAALNVAVEDMEESRGTLRYGTDGGRQVDLLRRLDAPTPRLLDQPVPRVGDLSRILR
jgi:hypothetical protein